MADEKTSCVLRLFGAQPGQLAGAVEQFPPQWQASAQWKSRGGETLLALQAASPTGLKKAAQSLRARLPAELYGAGDTSLAAAAVEALERHNKLLVCSDAAAGALLEERLETVPGAEKVYDFGAVSYAHPKTGPLIEKRARQRLTRDPGHEGDPARLALARALAARRVVGAELSAGCGVRENGEHVLVLATKKGCWMRTVPAGENAALWLLDVIRRAAAGLPQAEETSFLPAHPKRRRGRKGLFLLCLLALAAVVGYWYLSDGDWQSLMALPRRIQQQGWDGVKDFWQAYQPKAGVKLV